MEARALTFKIRSATGADSLAAAEVVRAVFEEYGFIWEPDGYHADLHDLEGHYLSRGAGFWVCEAGGQIVGTCGLISFPRIPGDIGKLVTHDGVERVAGTDCSLERLYVHPSARRLGIGQALFEVSLEHGRTVGCEAMEIWSDKEFVAAHRLYKRYGAEVVGDRIHDDPDQAEEWGLYLRLRRQK